MYKVTCKDRPWPGRWRSGRFFPRGVPVFLPDGEMTGAIRQDPELLVEEVPEETPAAAAAPEPPAEGEAERPVAPRTGRQPRRPRTGGK